MKILYSGQVKAGCYFCACQSFPTRIGQIRFLAKIPKNQMISIAFDQEIYDKIKEKLLKKDAASGCMDFVVNREWAEKQMAEEEWVKR